MWPTRARKLLDDLDTKLLAILQNDCRIPTADMAAELGIPKSTVHYRIRRLEADNIISQYCAKVDAARLGMDYFTIASVHAKHGPDYQDKIGQTLAEIPGVLAAYVVLGETDFIVLIRSRDRAEYMDKFKKLIDMPEIQRISTQIVAKVI